MVFASHRRELEDCRGYDCPLSFFPAVSSFAVPHGEDARRLTHCFGLNAFCNAPRGHLLAGHAGLAHERCIAELDGFYSTDWNRRLLAGFFPGATEGRAAVAAKRSGNAIRFCLCKTVTPPRRAILNPP